MAPIVTAFEQTGHETVFGDAILESCCLAKRAGIVPDPDGDAMFVSLCLAKRAGIVPDPDGVDKRLCEPAFFPFFAGVFEDFTGVFFVPSLGPSFFRGVLDIVLVSLENVGITTYSSGTRSSGL